MKFKLVLVFAFLLTVQFNVFSQSYFGIKGGYTNAWPDYGQTVLPDNAQTDVNGLNFSLLYYKPLNKHFHIGIEPGFIQRGAACFPGWQPVFVGDTKVKLNYVELPIMASFNVPLSKTNFGIYAKLGYGAAFLLSAMQELIDLNSKAAPIRSRIDLGADDSRLIRIDHGLHSSLGIAYTIGNNHKLILESNFYYGLSNYDKINVAKNRSLNVSVGYVMGF